MRWWGVEGGVEVGAVLALLWEGLLNDRILGMVGRRLSGWRDGVVTICLVEEGRVGYSLIVSLELYFGHEVQDLI